MKKLKRRSDCPTSNTLDLLGDKWTFLLLRDMFFQDKSRYGQFLTSDEKIATNILADRLELMEEHGLVKTKVCAENKSHNEYIPTAKAVDLLPILAEMMIWGSKYFDKTITIPTDLLKKLKRDKEGTLKEYAAKFRK
ncbi:helix-turn-helix transcriptional regulator [Pseudoflavitalea sp. G-6-1-2]|uniref:winged helix-turn-helix transcriptional regulator n=1 Tax=Pseudoflavitalea sp. G-6-1-2 TaxID=2728841 RepID=UPI00146C6C03|nr:helix-turn-helix domain-containing protein [Pseudoflavitalea sp. G-6-1-2]NML21228.1 helix-turn-helix transcriptional regulator [Pseudoflavitalea sp. G-6-1-2]